jgi:hypothetical protein
MFNIFINDIFDFVKKGDLHNYTDDNTLSHGSNSFVIIIKNFLIHHSFLISIVKGYGVGSQRPLISPLRWQRHIGYYLTDSCKKGRSAQLHR